MAQVYEMIHSLFQNSAGITKWYIFYYNLEATKVTKSQVEGA